MLGILPRPWPALAHRRSQDSAILVTGCSSGIGRQIVLDLLKTGGYTVFATVRNERDGEELKRLAKSVTSALDKEQKGELVVLMVDVRMEQSINDARDQIGKWIESKPNIRRNLIAVVNNSGISDTLPMELEPISNVEEIIDVNFLGVVRIVKAVLPFLRQSSGRIVAISSLNGGFAVPMMSSYVASKHALEGWCDTIRMELLPQNVQVSIVKPGAISTPIFEKSRKSVTPEALTSLLTPESKTIGEKYYKFFLDNAEQFIHGLIGRAIDPAFVSISVLHSIESRFPQSRYHVGLDCVGLGSLRYILPDRVMDMVSLFGFKLIMQLSNWTRPKTE